MTGTALVPATQQRGAMSINLRNVDYGLGKKTIDRYINSVGGSSFKKNYPGVQLLFKKGDWLRGFGDKQALLPDGHQIIVNVPNMMAGYMKWTELDNGKKRPVYSEMRFPAAGDDPVERESLDDNDENEWELNERGQPDDPWKPILVFPVRELDGEEVDHIMLSTKSSVIAGFNLFRDIIEEMSMHAGQLPVVALSSKTASRDVVAMVKGKEKKSKQSWEVPTFTPKAWVKAEDIDNPINDGVGVQVTAGEEAELGKVETRARKAAPKAIEKPAPKGKQSRKQIEVEDDTTL